HWIIGEGILAVLLGIVIAASAGRLRREPRVQSVDVTVLFSALSPNRATKSPVMQITTAITTCTATCLTKFSVTTPIRDFGVITKVISSPDLRLKLCLPQVSRFVLRCRYKTCRLAKVLWPASTSFLPWISGWAKSVYQRCSQLVHSCSSGLS